jgi:hypothetical protein
LDIQTNKQDYFYHSQQISYDPNVAGKLTLTADKFFQSFEKEINKESKNFDLTETFAEVAGKLE